MRPIALACLLAAAGTAAPASAQPAPPAGLPQVPTTRVIAIGTVEQPRGAPAPERMQAEVRDTVRLYLAGKIDQWFVRRDRPGVVFILDVADVATAQALLAALPLSRAGVMRFDLIPVGPLAPLGLLAAGPKP